MSFWLSKNAVSAYRQKGVRFFCWCFIQGIRTWFRFLYFLNVFVFMKYFSFHLEAYFFPYFLKFCAHLVKSRVPWNKDIYLHCIWLALNRNKIQYGSWAVLAPTSQDRRDIDFCLRNDTFSLFRLNFRPPIMTPSPNHHSKDGATPKLNYCTRSIYYMYVSLYNELVLLNLFQLPVLFHCWGEIAVR